MVKLCKNCLHYDRIGCPCGCSKLIKWVSAWTPNNLPDWINIRVLSCFEPPEYWYCKEWEKQEQKDV